MSPTDRFFLISLRFFSLNEANPQRDDLQPAIMSEQFTVGGQSIPNITTGYGAFLVVWGIVIS